VLRTAGTAAGLPGRARWVPLLSCPAVEPTRNPLTTKTQRHKVLIRNSWLSDGLKLASGDRRFGACPRHRRKPVLFDVFFSVL